MRAVGRQNGLPVAEPETSDYVSSLLKPIFKFIKLVSNFEESMAQTVTTFDTQHSGTIHDSQLDYYGKRLATASSDHTIRVWDVSSESPQWLAELRGHEGPVWQVCWAHPKYGSMLASCSYDKRAIVWREERAGDWVTIYKYEDHAGSVNGVAFAPWELGLHLAVVSSDGSVSVHTHMPDNTWSKKQFQAHANGVTSVSWAPASRCSSLSNGPTLQQQSMSVKQIVTGGCDNQIRVWSLDENTGEWSEAFQLTDGSHTDWVRDVAWKPNVGVPSNVIASGSEDGTVILWTQETENAPWKNGGVLNFNAPVWRVSWSITGTVLAVASGDNNVALFKETLDGKWEKVSSVLDNGVPNTIPSNTATNGQQAPPATMCT
eukprot:GHVN01071954.1.p1 GENE.GHVN01071954.1~~GHVN01071954.1.p1  ORF type:complete len:375 (-),score=37.11 GHVN01071954.1:41-1165(-)